jgi:hypothetical protein
MNKGEQHTPVAPETDLRSPSEAEWRSEVVAFADAMERKLRANDWKGGWKEDTSGALMVRVREEFREFDAAHLAYPRGTEQYRTKLLDEAADVANMAMMVVDVCGGLTVRAALTPSEAAPEPSVVVRLRSVVVQLLHYEAALMAKNYDIDSPSVKKLFRDAQAALEFATSEAAGSIPSAVRAQCDAGEAQRAFQIEWFLHDLLEMQQDRGLLPLDYADQLRSLRPFRLAADLERAALAVPSEGIGSVAAQPVQKEKKS